MFEDVWASTGDILKPVAPDLAEGNNTTDFPAHSAHNWVFNICMLGLQYLEQYGTMPWDAEQTCRPGMTVREGATSYLCVATSTPGEVPSATPAKFTALPSQGLGIFLANVIGLQAALDGKSAIGHNHTGTYAPLSHTHTIANVTGLESALGLRARWTNSGFNTPTMTLSASDPPAAGTAGRIWAKY